VFICVDEETVPAGNIVGAKDAEVANDAVAGIKVILFAALAVPNNDPLKAVA